MRTQLKGSGKMSRMEEWVKQGVLRRNEVSGEKSRMEEWVKQVGVEEERGQRGQRPKDQRERE